MRWLTDYFFWGSVGFLCGSVLIVRNLRKNDLSCALAVLFVTLSIYAGLLGARIVYVLTVQPGLFRTNFPLAIAFWQGNLSWLGGVISGFTAFALMMRLARKPVWSNLGSAAPGIALAHVISRIGCLCQGCCYGAPTDMPWAIYSSQIHAWVHPTQIYDMFGEFIAFLVLQWQFRLPHRRKFLLPWYGVLLSIHRFISEGFRGTPAGPEIIEGLRFYQAICVMIFVFCVCAILLLWKKKKGLIPVGILFALALIGGVLCQPDIPARPALNLDQPQPYLVLTRTSFVGELEKWKALRQNQGYEVLIGSWDDSVSAEAMHDWIQKNSLHGCRYILVVGDAADDSDASPSWHMPTQMVPIKNTPLSESYASDANFGDLDNNGVPEILVGRLPVRSPDELNRLLQKIVHYETIPLDADWFRTVIWMGANGYQQRMSDLANYLSPKLPPWLETLWIHPESDPSLPTPLNQPELFLTQFRRPMMMSLIISHGSSRSVIVSDSNKRPVFLAVEHVQALNIEQVTGPLFLLACQTGRFNLPDSEGPSLSETFLLNSGGPVAVLSSTASVQPLTNYYLARAMSQQMYNPTQSLGDFWMAVRQQAEKEGARTFAEIFVNDPIAPDLKYSLDPENTWILPGILARQIKSFVLLGDPASKFQIPAPMTCSILANEQGQIRFSANTPHKNLSIDQFRQGQTSRLRQSSISSPWSEVLQLHPDYYSSKDYIRILAYNGAPPAYFIYNNNPFINKQ